MTDPTPTTTPPPAGPITSSVQAALTSAATTAASSIEANAVAYIQSLEAKAASQLGVVESKLLALWVKVKGYAPLILAAAVLSGAGYVAAHFFKL